MIYKAHTPPSAERGARVKREKFRVDHKSHPSKNYLNTLLYENNSEIIIINYFYILYFKMHLFQKKKKWKFIGHPFK